MPKLLLRRGTLQTMAGTVLEQGEPAYITDVHESEGEIQGFVVGDGTTPVPRLYINNLKRLSGLGMPSNSYVNLTLGASGTMYTAPANGYVELAVVGVENSWIYIYKQGAARLGTSIYTNTNVWTEGNIIVQKGDTFYVQYGNTPNVQIFQFIYAQGEV